MKTDSLVAKQDRSAQIMRVLSIVVLAMLFISPLNPARVSGMIHQNTSLFTIITSWNKISDNFVRALTRGWIEEISLNLTYIFSLLIGIAMLLVLAATCTSLGNEKLKELSYRLGMFGSLLGLLGTALLIIPFLQMVKSPELQRIDPILSVGYFIFIVMFLILFIWNLYCYKTRELPEKDSAFEMHAQYRLFLMILPFFVLSLVFSYLPLYGWRYAFFNYRPGTPLSMDDFAGFRWFRLLFGNPATRNDLIRVIKNTLVMSALGIGTAWLPMLFAMFMVEIRSNSVRRFVQTFTTIPNFISWVLVYTFAFALFSTEGFVNQMLLTLNLSDRSRNFLMSGDNIWIKMWAWGTWKGLGWSAIIYIAAIMGIDQQLYEAASIDGAGRFQRMRHVTLPGLLPTFSVLLLLSIANILSNGMEQYFVFKNSANQSSIEVLDLYVYTLGLGTGSTGNIPLATLIGMFKSLISVVLLFVANRMSKLIRGESIV